MKFLDKIFNRDIYSDIKNNILDYQHDLSVEANKKIKDKEFKDWLITKKWIFPDLSLRLEFNNLYFNYRLHELLADTTKISAKEYKFQKEIWLLDYVDKFWFLQKKYESHKNMTQEEFETFFLLGGILK